MNASCLKSVTLIKKYFKLNLELPTNLVEQMRCVNFYLKWLKEI